MSSSHSTLVKVIPDFPGHHSPKICLIEIVVLFVKVE